MGGGEERVVGLGSPVKEGVVSPTDEIAPAGEEKADLGLRRVSRGGTAGSVGWGDGHMLRTGRASPWQGTRWGMGQMLRSGRAPGVGCSKKNKICSAGLSSECKL